MKMNEKDEQILYHIIQYCDEIEATIKRFGKSERLFKKDFIYRNACSMPLLQIGELAKRLSEDFIELSTKTNKVPWKQIKGMRDMFAHQYQEMDKKIIWDTLNDNIPKLNKICRSILREHKLETPSKPKIDAIER